MADYSLRDAWWLQSKGPDNPLPAMQLGASIVQHRAQMDLKERELANDIARTSLMRDEVAAKLQLQTQISAANSELAKAASQISDWSDPEQMQPIYNLGSKYGFVVGTKGWEGIINTHERAVTAKRMSENTQSLIQSRQERSALNSLIEQRRALIADSTVDVNDARIQKLNQDISLEERKLAVQEGNLNLRGRDINLKEQRLDTAKWSPEDRIELKERTKVVHEDSTLTSAEKDQAIQEIRGEIEGNRLQREKFKAAKTQREGLKAVPAAPLAAPAQPVAPTNTPTDLPIKKQNGNMFQQQSDGTWKYLGPAQ